MVIFNALICNKPYRIQYWQYVLYCYGSDPGWLWEKCEQEGWHNTWEYELNPISSAIISHILSFHNYKPDLVIDLDKVFTLASRTLSEAEGI